MIYGVPSRDGESGAGSAVRDLEAGPELKSGCTTLCIVVMIYDEQDGLDWIAAVAGRCIAFGIEISRFPKLSPLVVRVRSPHAHLTPRGSAVGSE